jgi:hypothetical protein
MKPRHAAAPISRWVGIFILVMLSAISSIGGVLLVIYGCFYNGVGISDLMLVLCSLITLAVGLAVCFGRSLVKSSESTTSGN